jgi:hypothetical protein
VREFHELKAKLARRTSAFGATLFFQPESRPFLGRDDVTPLFAFEAFLQEVDQRAADLGERLTHRFSALSPPSARTDFANTDSCAVRLSGIEVSRGLFGVFANGQFIGALEAGYAGEPIAMPCPKEPGASILVRDLSLRQASRARAKELVLVRMEQAGGTAPAAQATAVQATIVPRADGTIKSVKAVVTVP